MVRHKHVFLATAFLLAMVSVCWAETYDFELTAGGSSLTAGAHYKSYLDTGYLRFGGSGVWTDENDTEYKWAGVDFMVGSDTMRPGLNLEIGLRGILGSAEDGGYSGDVGAVGFAGMASYLFPTDVVPIPIEVFSGVTWSPGLLSFRDTDSYTEFYIGAGVRIISNASIIVNYATYRVEMDSGPSPWILNHDTLRIGLALRF